MPIKKILVIINPISGYSRSRELPMKLKRRLESEGFEVGFHLTRWSGDGGEFARENGKSFDCVVISGGDGTVREVVSGLAESGVPVTIYPSGTENLFAKEMGLSADCDQLVQTLKWGRRIVMDMGKVNGRLYLLLSGIGFDAQVLIHLNKFRTGNITHLTYFWPIWRTLWEYRLPAMTVEADGDVILNNERGLVFVSNISRYAVGLRICDLARYDDGLLDVCIYRCDSRLELVGHSWRTIFRKHRANPRVIYRQARNIKVSSEKTVPIETDGDSAGVLPAEYEVVPRAIEVILPPG
jgi:YegS/Rv2252/BmrU family lipid kinase